MIAIEPIGVTDETAASLFELSATTLHKLKAQGLIRGPVMMGASARWNVQWLKEDFAALPVSTLLPPPKRRKAE